MSKVASLTLWAVAFWDGLRIFGHFLSAKTNYLFGLACYLILATGLFGVYYAVVPLLIIAWLYPLLWHAHRAYLYKQDNREVPSVGAMIKLWWLSRQHIEISKRKFIDACEGYPGLSRPGSGRVIVPGTKAKPVTPKLSQVRTNLDGDVLGLVYSGTVQVPLRNLVAAQDDIAASIGYGCKEVVIRPTRNKGVGKVAIYWTDPLEREIHLGDLPKPKDRRYFSFAVRRDGSPMLLRKDMSFLVGGMTGQGKSNALWVIIASFIADGEYLDLYVSDAKGGIEMTLLGKMAKMYGGGRVRVVEYVDNGPDTEEKLLPKVISRMEGRRKWMRDNGIDKLEFSTKENPYIVFIEDEVTLIPKALKAGASGHLGNILTGGRASLTVAWLATQDARTDTIPGSLRTLIPGRFCLATDTSEATVAILGPKAETERGARCSELDEQRDMGVCYAGTEESRLLERAKIPLVSKAERKQIAQGIVPQSMLDRTTVGPKCIVYWCPSFPRYDADGNPLKDRLEYVGITSVWCKDHKKVDTCARFAQHAARDWAWCKEHGAWENWWLKHVDVSRIVTKVYPSVEAARAVEKESIKTDWPIWNKVHNWNNPLIAHLRRAGLPRWRKRRVEDEPEDVYVGMDLVEGEIIAEDEWPTQPQQRELESADLR